jgi:hypothetical protein
MTLTLQVGGWPRVNPPNRKKKHAVTEASMIIQNQLVQGEEGIPRGGK